MNITWTDSDPHGQGDPVVFLHAFPLNSGMWNDQVSDLAGIRRTITLDWPGFGGSPLSALPPGSDQQTGVEIYANCLLDLLDRLEIDRTHLCGLSMGGYIALSLYRLAPERVRSLILCDTRAGADSPEVRRGRYEMASIVRQAGDEGIERLASTMIERLLGDSSRSSNPDLIGRVTKMIRQSSPEGVSRALEAMAERRDCTDLLPLIGGPSGVRTLIIVGNEDKLTPPSEMKRISESVASSEMFVIERAGHLPNLEQPESFNRRLREFIL
ncbi:MAG: alpha/beta fold hydrolase [Acidobacteria bacterium]|nr:alpha/beta fold hydrolase [Acidobacteriota bacterium]